MGIPDTDIRFWPQTAAQNKPTDATFIGRDLAKQWRNIKSNARGQSLDKEFEERPEAPSSVAHAGGGLGSIAFPSSDGNLSSLFAVMRKVRLTAGSSGDQLYCGVQSTSYDVPTTTTTVVLCELTAALVPGETYAVDVGVENPDLSSLPLYRQNGSITISDANTDGVATFGHDEPDLDYFPKATVLAYVGSGPTGQTTVQAVVKGLSSMTISLRSAPGVGNSTTVGWSILRET